MAAGHEFEPCIPMLFAARTGAIIDKTSEGDWIAADKKQPFLRVSPDRLFYPEGTPVEKQTYENAYILECKTTRYAIDKDNIPLYWRIQVQYQMAVMGIKKAVVGWISYANDLKFDYAVIEHNEDMWKYIKSNLEKFWNDNVLGNKMPDTILNNEDTLRRWPEAQKTKQRVANDTLLQLHERYCQLKEQSKGNKTEIDELEQYIKEYMQDAETVVNTDQKILFQWSNVKSPEKFQMDKFKDEHPDIYQSYLTPAETTRRFSVKMPKSTKQSA